MIIDMFKDIIVGLLIYCTITIPLLVIPVPVAIVITKNISNKNNYEYILIILSLLTIFMSISFGSIVEIVGIELMLFIVTSIIIRNNNWGTNSMRVFILIFSIIAYFGLLWHFIYNLNWRMV